MRDRAVGFGTWRGMRWDGMCDEAVGKEEDEEREINIIICNATRAHLLHSDS